MSMKLDIEAVHSSDALQLMVAMQLRTLLDKKIIPYTNDKLLWMGKIGQGIYDDGPDGWKHDLKVYEAAGLIEPHTRPGWYRMTDKLWGFVVMELI